MHDNRNPIHGGKVEKGVSEKRDGFKPTAPADLVLPKPTKVPPPPKEQSSSKK